jgi:hypothetical protein
MMNKEVLRSNRLSEWKQREYLRWRQREDLRKSNQQTESKTKPKTSKNDGE